MELRRACSSQALKNAGADPSRGSILQALSKITSFNGGYIVTTSNPVGQDDVELLPRRPGGQRPVGAAGRPAGEQQHQWLSLRLPVRDAAKS